jgi:biopolymer transport protein ExbB
MDSLSVMTDVVQSQTNLFSIAAKGGFLMIILLVISVLAIAVIIERFIKLKKAKMKEREFLSEIYNYISQNYLEKAIQLCEQKESIISDVILKALEVTDRNPEETKEVVESAVRKHIHILEKNLGTLATFAAVAPLIGFLGTVTGMVKVFMKIGETGGGVDISLLAGGIWEALITTIGGLTVGIITILFYNFFTGKIEELAHDLEQDTNEFLQNYRRIQK